MEQSSRKIVFNSKDIKKLLLEVIGLQTSRGRLIFFVAISFAIFLTPFNWLENLSLWKFIGIDSPSIGLTRAYWFLLHGRISDAVMMNRYIFIIIIVGLPILYIDALKLLKRLRSNGIE